MEFQETVIAVIGLFLFFVEQVLGGECCKAYYDLSLEYHDATWCSDYCCGASAIGVGILECCSVSLVQAPSSDTQTVCLDFFAKNVWAPIVVGLVGLGAIGCCCFCVYKCCSSNNRTGFVAAAPAQPSVVVVPQHMVQQPMAPGPAMYGPVGASPQQPSVYPAFPGATNAYPTKLGQETV